MVRNNTGNGQVKEVKLSVDVIIGALAELGGKFLDFTLEILRMRRDRRSRIARYLEEVGKCIGAVGSAIEHGQDVSGKCGKLNGHLFALQKTVKPALGKKAESLQELINRAYRVEDLAVALEPSAKTQRAQYVAQLRAISGTFLAVAKAVQASV